MKEDIKSIFGIAIVYFIIELLGVTCPIKFLTGISCAGCGISRACLSAFRGDFAMAFYYHPLFILVIPMVLIFLLKDKFSLKGQKALALIFAFTFLIAYVIRLIFFPNDIVCVKPLDGFIEKTVINIFYKLINLI